MAELCGSSFNQVCKNFTGGSLGPIVKLLSSSVLRHNKSPAPASSPLALTCRAEARRRHKVFNLSLHLCPEHTAMPLTTRRPLTLMLFLLWRLRGECVASIQESTNHPRDATSISAYEPTNHKRTCTCIVGEWHIGIFQK